MNTSLRSCHRPLQFTAWFAVGILLFALLLLIPERRAAAQTMPSGWYYPTGSGNFAYLGFLGYNSQTYPYHLAQDMSTGGRHGAPIYSIGDGEIILRNTGVGGYGYDYGAGGALVARYQAADGTVFTALYGHLDNMAPLGHVSAGQVIGYTNGFEPPHVHFGVHLGSDPSAHTHDSHGNADPWQGYTQSRNDTCGFTDPVPFLNAHPRGGSTGVKDNSAFVADVTVPDNTAFYTNQTFVKTWRMKNTGNTIWGGGYQWVFDGGTQMGGVSPAGVPSVGPGGTGDISISMQTPGTAGTYKGYWRLRGPNGEFGQQVYVLINVINPPPSTPPSVTFDATYKNQWFGPSGLNSRIVSWSLSDQGGGVGGLSQSWDHDDDKNLGTSPQFPNSTSGYMQFSYLDPPRREGQHTVYVRAWNRNHSRYTDYSSGWYGYDASPPTVALTTGQAAGATYVTAQHVTFHISEPYSGLAKWGAAWDADPGAQYTTGDGGSLDLPTGTHTLHVHAWDKAGNNQDWAFGPFTLRPAPPVFVLSATAPASAAPGAAVALSATVLDTGGAAIGDIVDVEVYNATGAQIAQKFYTGQNFAAGGSQTYSPSWTAPSAPGMCIVKVGIFTGDWGQMLGWNDNAANLTITTTDGAPFNFENGTQGWVSSGGMIGGVSTSPLHVFAGGQSLAVSFSGTGPDTQRVFVPAPPTPAGALITFHVWVPAISSINAIQPFVLQGASGGWAWTGNYQPVSSLTPGAWNTIQMTVPAGAAMPLAQIGVEFSTSGPWTGTCYVDAVGW